jgi:hypothetical protein
LKLFSPIFISVFGDSLLRLQQLAEVSDQFAYGDPRSTGLDQKVGWTISLG